MTDIKKDLQAVQDALDTAADALLPDSLYGPMFGKADTGLSHVRQFIARYLGELSGTRPAQETDPE